MLDKGMSHGARSSMRQLAERSGMSVETVRMMVYGERVPEDETVNAVADALGVNRITVAGWAKQTRTVAEPWYPPAESDRLSQSERAALDQLIRAIVERTPDGPSIAPNDAVVQHLTGGKTYVADRGSSRKPAKPKSVPSAS